MNEANTRKHLAKANKNIKAGSDRIRKQKERVKTLAADGHRTEIAEKTLENFTRMVPAGHPAARPNSSRIHSRRTS